LTDISLRGLIEVASDILAGVFREISLAFGEIGEEDWDVYDVLTPA
jgi:hypothetical protein